MAKQPKPTSFNLRRSHSLEAVLAVAALVLAYLWFVQALDTGSLLQYVLAFVLLVFGLKHVVLLALSVVRSRKKKA